MTIRKTVLSITVILFTTIHTAGAQDNSLQKQTSPSFEQLLQAYTERQPQQLTLSGFKQLQQAKQDQANSWMAGDVNLVVHHENGNVMDDNDSQNWQVGAAFPVRLPSQKKAMADLAETSQQNLSIETKYLQWLASKQIRQLIWEVKSAQTQLEITEMTVVTSQQLLEAINKQFELGEAAKIDVVLAEQFALEDRTALLQVQADLLSAKTAYQKWTGFERLPANIIETKIPLKIDQHPHIQRLSTKLQMANGKLKQLKSEKSGQPSLYIGAQQDRIASQTETSVIMEVAIPLGMNSNFDVNKAEQGLRIQQSQSDLDAAKQSLAIEQKQAEQLIVKQQKTIVLTQKQSKLADQALDMSFKAYKLGEISIHNLLQTQQNATQANLNHALAQLKLGQAIANYNQISGHILGAHN